MSQAGYRFVEINPEKLDFWEERLDLDPAFTEMLSQYRPGKESSARFTVAYDSTTLEVQGYGLSLDTEDTSVNLFRPVSAASTEGTVVEEDGDRLIASHEERTVTPLAAVDMDGRSLLIYSDIDLEQELGAFQYERKEAHRLGEVLVGEDSGFLADMYDFFGVSADAEAFGFEPAETSKLSQFKEYLEVIGEEPEYAALQAGKVMRRMGQGLVQGSLVGVAMSMGAVYGVVGFLAATQQLGRDQMEAVADGLVGKYVDDAVNSENPRESLKSPYLVKSLFCAASGVATYLMQPQFLAEMANPAVPLAGLFLAQQATDALEDSLNDKIGFAVREELIKNSEKMKAKGHDKHFYQLKGTEDMVTKYARIVPFLGSAIATGALFAAGGAVSPLAFTLASIGIPMWAGGNMVWYAYRSKPDVMMEVDADEHLVLQDGYVLDSGWEMRFERLEGEETVSYNLENPKVYHGKDGKLNIPMDMGDMEWGVKLKYGGDGVFPDYTEDRSFINKMPGFVQKMAFFKEKESWDIGEGDLRIGRFSTDAYDMVKVDDHTYAFGTKAYIEHLEGTPVKEGPEDAYDV